jgi:hypothetical protein
VLPAACRSGVGETAPRCCAAAGTRAVAPPLEHALLRVQDRARLLQFITGSSRVPLGGFRDFRPPIQLSRSHATDRLPIAHTCSNTIDLPTYSTIEDMRRLLLIAVTEGSQGFSFA